MLNVTPIGWWVSLIFYKIGKFSIFFFCRIFTQLGRQEHNWVHYDISKDELSSSKTVAVRSIWILDFWDLAKFLEKVLSIKVEHFLTFSKSHQICSKFCGRVAGHIKKILAPQVFAVAQKLWPWEEKVLSIKVEHFLTFSKSHQICSKLCGREPGHIIKTFAPQVLVSSSKTVAVRSIWNLDFWDLE